MIRLPLLLFLLACTMTVRVFAIFCYECTGGRADQTCGHYAGTSCEYGFFGCVKISTYSGGVDKMGNFLNDPRSLMSIVRGCNMLPVGGADACQQQTILGLRIITCYCYNDYCNGIGRNNITAFLIMCSVFLIIQRHFVNFT